MSPIGHRTALNPSKSMNKSSPKITESQDSTSSDPSKYCKAIDPFNDAPVHGNCEPIPNTCVQSPKEQRVFYAHPGELVTVFATEPPTENENEEQRTTFSAQAGELATVLETEPLVEHEDGDTEIDRKVSVHNTPHCGTSPLFSMPLVSNASPIGGMSFFKVDAPTSRFINTGMKIDFQNTSNEKPRNTFKTLQNRVSLSENSKRISVSSSVESGFQIFGANQTMNPISSTPTGKKKTFSIFEDPEIDRTKAANVSSSMTLRDLDSNIIANNNVDFRSITRQPKKRRPSGSIGNQSKKQIL